MKKLIYLILIGCFSSEIIAENPLKGTNSIATLGFIYHANEVDFPSCHASTIVETNEGILAAWFGGFDEGNSDVCIYTASNLSGKWNKPIKVAEGIQDGKRFPCWNPVLFRKDNGEIVLYYKVGPNPREWWGLFKTSMDNGKTWSAETKIPENLLGPIKNKPVRLPDGRILYPSSFESSRKWNIYMETSDQDLKNWQKIGIDNKNFKSIQPTILFHPDGTLQLLCRSMNKKINESWSKDNGQTWSALVETQLPNNDAGIDAVTLSDGMQLLVFNPITKGRQKLGVAVSKDGINWEAAALLENEADRNAEFSYPAVIQTKDGLVHITYTWNRKLIKHVVIEPKNLKTKPFLNGIWPEE
jgi:alpha-L-fucosidase